MGETDVQQRVPENERPYDWRSDRQLAGCAVATALLVVAATNQEHGEGFYTFLRIYVSGAASILALLGWRRGRVWVPLSAALIAILFNPIRPIEMAYPDAWLPYDWGAAAWFTVVGCYPLLLRHHRKVAEWIAAVLILAALASPLILKLGSSNENANNIMNVDENLTTTDLNATDVNATDLNATDANASGFDANNSDSQEVGASTDLNDPPASAEGEGATDLQGLSNDGENATDENAD